MKFCDKCGSELPEGTSFCPGCGQAINGANQEQTQQQVNSAPVNAQTSEKGIAVLAYFGFLSLIALYVMKPKTEFGIFHAKQGVNLFIINIIVGFATGLIQGVLNQMDLAFIGSTLGLVGMAIYILNIMGLVYAVQGKMQELPIIGQIKIIK